MKAFAGKKSSITFAGIAGCLVALALEKWGVSAPSVGACIIAIAGMVGAFSGMQGLVDNTAVKGNGKAVEKNPLP